MFTINMHSTILKGDDAFNNSCAVILEIFRSYFPGAPPEQHPHGILIMADVLVKEVVAVYKNFQ